MDKMLSEMLKMGGGKKNNKKKKGGRAKGKSAPMGKGPGGMMEGVFDFGELNGMLEDSIADTLFGEMGMGNMSEQ